MSATPFITIQRLRQRGFTVTLEGVDGPDVSDPSVMDQWLERRWPEIERVLRAEAHPMVRDAMAIFGVPLRDVDVREGRGTDPTSANSSMPEGWTPEDEEAYAAIPYCLRRHRSEYRALSEVDDE